VFGQLLDYFPRTGAKIIVLSEYGIVPVNRPVHLNRELRRRGLLEIRHELGRELLDAGASIAFTVADHQVAHVYVNDPARITEVRAIVESIPGVAKVYGAESKHEIHLDHPRSGELVVLAEPDAWFTYYFWLEESRAPDFARTVDIHRKPGYDPVELFIDPRIVAPKMRIAWTLLKRRLGFRSLMNVIGTDATLVRGSHGLPPTMAHTSPLLIADREIVETDLLEAPEVHGVILRALSANTSATEQSMVCPVAGT